jgi:glycosyltransferase involved in cell wall biosynthesis
MLPNTLREIRLVADLDPMIGFVSPRLNTGKTSEFPISSNSNGTQPSEFDSIAAFETVAQHLPRKTYVPSAPPFCLLVRGKMLQEFGAIEALAGPSLEENDLIARANLRGYRTAIANHAFAFYKGPSGFSDNAQTIEARYPHYHAAIMRYPSSSEARALRLFACLAAKPPLPIAFDFSSYGRRQDGTTEYGTKTFASFVRLFGGKYRLHAFCDKAAWSRHGCDKLDGVIRLSTDSDTLFAAVIRLNQPFDIQAVALGPSRGAVTMVNMLDSIAYDCLQICPPELERLWSFAIEYSDVAIFPSAFSAEQFNHRFTGARHGRELISMPSTDINDYRHDAENACDYFLVIGNAFAHKAVRETVAAIRAKMPGAKVRVLGIKLPHLPDLISFESGLLDPDFVQSLFAGAKGVIFPSHCEGFGFPVMHALGSRKPVFVRDLPVYEEIRQRVAAPGNIHTFASLDELTNILYQEIRWDDDFRQIGDVGWDRTAREIEAALDAALKAATFEGNARRLTQLDLLADAVAGLQARVNIANIESSTSWRLTEPLRKLKTLLWS